ncbi:hypothetical protein PIB30_093200 [Stylosanthes scabra]|uniref:Uncharacterized protein n=1 Tax=Stylosanthes scabra TaxID=79078 RepID=A0ABU6WYE3_9FABA|nr:hypothetical protein [Stylosanthes scabra]
MGICLKRYSGSISGPCSAACSDISGGCGVWVEYWHRQRVLQQRLLLFATSLSMRQFGFLSLELAKGNFLEKSKLLFRTRYFSFIRSNFENLEVS